MPPDDPHTREAFLEGLKMGLGRAARRGSSPPVPVEAPAGDMPAKGEDPTATTLHASHDFGFEERDTRVRSIAIVMVVAVTIIASSIGGLFVFIGRIRQADASHPPMTAQQTAAIIPPSPRLQDDPYRDLHLQQARETKLLETYSFADADRTHARIPLGRAMALVIGQPLDPVP